MRQSIFVDSYNERSYFVTLSCHRLNSFCLVIVLSCAGIYIVTVLWGYVVTVLWLCCLTCLVMCFCLCDCLVSRSILLELPCACLILRFDDRRLIRKKRCPFIYAAVSGIITGFPTAFAPQKMARKLCVVFVFVPVPCPCLCLFPHVRAFVFVLGLCLASHNSQLQLWVPLSFSVLPDPKPKDDNIRALLWALVLRPLCPCGIFVHHPTLGRLRLHLYWPFILVRVRVRVGVRIR